MPAFQFWFKMNNKRIIVLGFLVLLLSSCGFDDSFDKSLLSDFKKFQILIENHSNEIKGEYFEVKDDYGWIVKSNFKRLFDFLEKDDLERFQKLFDKEEIQRIEIHNSHHISFKIRPDYNNSLLHSEWKELWIIYDDEKTIQDLSDETNTSLLEQNWYKRIITAKRYIGG